MQYVEGGSLNTWLARLQERDEQLAVRDALRLGRQMADALSAAHQAGIIHRDLKPSNILLQPNGNAVLTDLGIAAVQSEETRLTQPDNVLGTPHYMSPEQALGNKVDGRADIYSLGIILYEMLGGRVPFDSDSPLAILHQHVYEQPRPLERVRPGLAELTYQVVARCLQKNPDHRFQTAAALVNALDQALAAEEGHLPAVREHPTPLTPPTPILPAKERPWWFFPAIALAVLVPLFLLLLAFGVYQFLKAASPGEPPFELPSPPVITIETRPGEAPGEGSPPAATPAPATTPIPTQVTANVTAVRLANAPGIDGNLADWPPDLVPVASAHRVFVDPSWDGSEDITAAWRLGWDSGNLYLGVTVLDDVHVQTRSDNQIFRGDSLDMQIDTNRTGDFAAGLSPDDFQIIFSPGDFSTVPPVVFRFRGSDAGRSTQAPGHSIVFQTQRTGNGYTLEAAIPWSDLETAPTSGLVLGIALNATDNDTPGTAVQEVFMSHVATRTFGDPTTWGTATLQ
jgi:hypothetical protein